MRLEKLQINNKSQDISYIRNWTFMIFLNQNLAATFIYNFLKNIKL